MPLEIPAHIAAKHQGYMILRSPNQFDHRAMILRTVCQLEYDFKLYLIEGLRKINPAIHDDLADEEQGMFGPDKAFGSLSKCLNVAKLLNLVTAEEAHDLKSMVTLRNMYAHGRKRQQLYEDEYSMAVVRGMYLVKNSTAVLGTRDEQDTFLCAASALNEIVLYKTSEVKEGRLA